MRQEPPKLQSTTLKTCSVLRMSGPITQTSPGTEREGRQGKIRKTTPDPAQEETSQEHTEQKKTRPGNSENVNKKKNHPPKSRKTTRKNIECSREAKVSYSRQRLEIHLRYAGPPVQTR